MGLISLMTLLVSITYRLECIWPAHSNSSCHSPTEKYKQNTKTSVRVSVRTLQIQKLISTSLMLVLRTNMWCWAAVKLERNPYATMMKWIRLTAIYLKLCHPRSICFHSLHIINFYCNVWEILEFSQGNFWSPAEFS